MKEITVDKGLVAYCGLYCGACGSFLRDKCPGCHLNEKASWCQIRQCCREKGYASCADCQEFADPKDCKKFNNLISKVFGIVFNSDRVACVHQIKEIGVDGHAKKMAALERQSIKRA